VNPNAAASRRHRARFRIREAWRPSNPEHDIVQSDLGQDRDTVPLHLTMQRELIATACQLFSQQRGEGIVGKLGLLQAHHVGLPLIEPWKQSRYPLLDRIHIPGGQPHGPTLAPD
jgi:hypothetical protein